jgi:hypothetical protein
VSVVNLLVQFSYSYRNQGVVFVQGAETAGVPLPITEGSRVLERLSADHSRQRFFALHLDLLLFQIQFPHISGVPLLDVVTVHNGRKMAVAVKSYVNGAYSNWPHVDVDQETLCALQLLGLTQFGVVPMHPQHQNPKFINWGYPELGLFATTLYHFVWKDAGSSANPLLCDSE